MFNTEPGMSNSEMGSAAGRTGTAYGRMPQLRLEPGGVVEGGALGEACLVGGELEEAGGVDGRGEVAGVLEGAREGLVGGGEVDGEEVSQGGGKGVIFGEGDAVLGEGAAGNFVEGGEDVAVEADEDRHGVAGEGEDGRRA